MVTIMINTFWIIVNAIGTLGGVSASINNISNIVQPIAGAVNTVNGYLAYVFYFIPKSTFLFIVGITLSVTAVRIAMAIINLIAW